MKEMVNRIGVYVIVMSFLWKNNRNSDRNWKMWRHAVRHWSVVVLWCWPYLPNGHPECPWLATWWEAWAFAMFRWHRGKLVMMGVCVWVAVSDVRVSVMIGSEAEVGEQHPRRSDETKQLHLLYLDQQLVLLNIWSIESLLSRPRVKKNTCSHSKYFKSGQAPKVVHREVRISSTIFQTNY